jgi:hypothetical protein
LIAQAHCAIHSTPTALWAIGCPDNAGRCGSDYHPTRDFTWAAQEGTSTGFVRVWVSVLPIPPCQPPPAYFPLSQPITYFTVYIIAKIYPAVKHYRNQQGFNVGLLKAQTSFLPEFSGCFYAKNNHHHQKGKNAQDKRRFEPQRFSMDKICIHHPGPTEEGQGQANDRRKDFSFSNDVPVNNTREIIGQARDQVNRDQPTNPTQDIPQQFIPLNSLDLYMVWVIISHSA